MTDRRTDHWVRAHPLACYFVPAYVFSWAIGVPLALAAHGRLAIALPLHYLTAYGPALAAIVVTAAQDGRAGLRALARRVTAVGGLRLWLLVGLVSPLLLFAMARALVVASGRAAGSWSALGRVNFLPDLGASAWVLWFLTSGLGEEFGWRGFALPRLQRTHSALAASVWLGLLWAGWHLPAFFYLPNYAAIGLRVFPGFAFGVITGSILCTWLYNSAGGSVLVVALWHASFNFVTASAAGAGDVAAVASVAVMLWALAVVWRYRPATLAGGPKQEL